MNPTTFQDSLEGKTPEEVKMLLLNFYSAMSSEQFIEHQKNLQLMAKKNGQEDEREEIICRLLASGMPVDEIATTLCMQVSTVCVIESNNAAIKLPKYKKTLELRRQRKDNIANR